MKKLREGVSTGSCMTGGAAAAAQWIVTGKCPDVIRVDTPIGKTLYLDVIPKSERTDLSQEVVSKSEETNTSIEMNTSKDFNTFAEKGRSVNRDRVLRTCGIIKDAGDDPDVTGGSEIVTTVELLPEKGEISFVGDEGIGVVTQEGLKLPVGEPAINPVPRQMVCKALREIIGDHGAIVTVSIPGGRELAKKTFNPRLGIEGGLSILGTTGIVRPMSEEAMKDSLMVELDMYAKQGHRSILFVLGTTGENALKAQFGEFRCVLQVSNYIGFMIEEAVERGFTDILIGGFVGKLVKVASGTMNTHSHISDGRIETICTHAALHGASTEVIRKIYACVTTKAAMKIVEEEGLTDIWKDMAQKASDYCKKTAHGMADVGIIFLDGSNAVLAESENARKVLERCLKWE